MRRLMLVGLVLFLLFEQVKTVTAQQVFESNNFVTKIGSPSGPPPNTTLAARPFVFYCQADPLWNQNSCQLNVAGCGPTSMAMIATFFGISVNPNEMDLVFQQNGSRQCGSGDTNLSIFVNSAWLKDSGFEFQAVAINNGRLDLNMAKQFLDNGYLILGSSLQFPCPQPGWCRNSTLSHIFVVDGSYPEKNMIQVRDPINCRAEHPEEYDTNKQIASNFPWLLAYAIKKMR